MIRIRLGVPLLVFVISALAQVQTTRVSPKVFTPYGTFERVDEGWRCNSVGNSPFVALRDLQAGDIVVSINGESLVRATPVGFLQFLRLTEFDIAENTEILRQGQRLKLGSSSGKPQIIASQNSFVVLHSSYPSIRRGDVLSALNQTSFKAMMATVTNPLTSVVNIGVSPGKVLHITRNGKLQDVSVGEPAVVRLIQFELDPAQEPPDAEIQGLNRKDVQLFGLRGRWTLLHFWATWCAPCVRHMPDLRELATRKDLFVAAIGFADTRDRLQTAASSERLLNVFAPSPELQRPLAVTGIPFGALLDPNGHAVLVVAGDMSPEQFKTVIADYVGRSAP